MGDLLIVVGILAVLVLIVGFWVMSVYNGLVRTRNAKDNNYSQIGIQLTRKYDLIPNLVKLAKGYMKHERATLEEVIDHYNFGGHPSPTVDPLMKYVGVGLLLSNEEKANLKAFLLTLSDEEFINNSNFSNPFN